MEENVDFPLIDVSLVYIDSYTDLAVLGLLCRAWMAGFHSLWL